MFVSRLDEDRNLTLAIQIGGPSYYMSSGRT